MSEIITVYELNWSEASISIYNNLNSGLWDNGKRIALHLPIFCKNYLGEDKYRKEKAYNNEYNNEFYNKFYICYDDDDELKDMSYSYFDINDMVFNDFVHSGCKKARVYTTIKPCYNL